MPEMRAGIRYAWAPAWRGVVRLVLGSLGGVERLSQLLARRIEQACRRGQAHRRPGLSVRYLEGATLSARKGKRAMATGPDDELDDYDLFMAVLEDIDSHFSLWLDSEIEAVTVNGWDNFCQFIMREEAAKRLLTDTLCLKKLEAAVAAIMPDSEIHITWPAEAKGGKI